MSEFLKMNEDKKNGNNDFDLLTEYGENHPFEYEKTKQRLEELKYKRDMLNGNQLLAEEVSGLRQTEPMRQGVRMEEAKIEECATEGLDTFGDENELMRTSIRGKLVEKKRQNAIDTQEHFEDQKHRLLTSTKDMITPTSLTIDGVSDEIIGNAIWKLEMDANDASDPDVAIKNLNKIKELRSMRSNLAANVVSDIEKNVDKAQEMQNKIQNSTVKGIKASRVPSTEETINNQKDIEQAQGEIEKKISDLDSEILDFE